MLTAQDIKKIAAVVATKKDVATLDKRIRRIEKNSATKADIASLGKRVGSVETRTEKVDSRLGGVEIALFATRQDLADLKLEVAGIHEKFDKQLILLDKLIAKVDDMRVEYSSISIQLSRHEEWIKQLAEKAGVKLEY